MARKFFQVCAGLLCLVLAYHLGAQRAAAQSGATIDGAGIAWCQSGGGVTCGAALRATGVIGRTFHYVWDNGVVGTFPEPVPGTGRVIATDGLAGAVVLENGDVLHYTGSGWALVGNLFGGPTATHSETWGGLKARYR